MADCDDAGVMELPLFAELSKAARATLLKDATVRRFPANTELAKDGERAAFLYVVIDGHVEIYSHYRDRETTLEVLGPGASLALAAVFLDQPNPNSARTLTPARILVLPAQPVRDTFNRDPALARHLAAELARSHSALMKEVSNQKLRTCTERLADWILAQDTAAGGRGHFTLPFEKKVLAAKLGVAPEVLSRSFAALISCGVAVDGRDIRISDNEMLRRCARPAVGEAVA